MNLVIYQCECDIKQHRSQFSVRFHQCAHIHSLSHFFGLKIGTRVPLNAPVNAHKMWLARKLLSFSKTWGCQGSPKKFAIFSIDSRDGGFAIGK